MTAATESTEIRGNGGTSIVDPPPKGWPRLHDRALHGLAGDVVKEIAPRTEADPAALLFTFLPYFGACVGSGSHFRVGSVRHPARLFNVIVGETAMSRKGTSEAEIRNLFRKPHSAEPGELIVPTPTGLSSGEGLVHHFRDREDGGDQDQRAVVRESEFGKTLVAAQRESSTLSQTLCLAWDTGNLQVMTRKDPIVATGIHVCIVGHITLEELAIRLAPTDAFSGFANRFGWVAARRSQILSGGGRIPDDVSEGLGREIGTQAALIRTLGDAEWRLSPDADAMWKVFYELKTLEPRHGVFGGVTARVDCMTLRMALAYAMLDWKPRTTLVVEDVHLAAAVACWNYLEASARHIFGGGLGNEKAEFALELVQERGENGRSRGDISKIVFKGRASRDRMDRIRDLLVRSGKIRVEIERPPKGRPREVWTAVPEPGADWWENREPLADDEPRT